MAGRSKSISSGTSSPPENIPGAPEITSARAPASGAVSIPERRAAISSGERALAGGRERRSSRTGPWSIVWRGAGIWGMGRSPREGSYIALQPWIDRLALERQDAKDALVDAAQGLAADEALQPFDSQRQLAQGERALGGEAAAGD